ELAVADRRQPVGHRCAADLDAARQEAGLGFRRELQPKVASILVARLDALEPALARGNLEEVVVGDRRGEVEPALCRAAVADLLRTAVLLENHLLDCVERAVESRSGGALRGRAAAAGGRTAAGAVGTSP